MRFCCFCFWDHHLKIFAKNLKNEIVICTNCWKPWSKLLDLSLFQVFCWRIVTITRPNVQKPVRSFWPWRVRRKRIHYERFTIFCEFSLVNSFIPRIWIILNYTNLSLFTLPQKMLKRPLWTFFQTLQKIRFRVKSWDLNFHNIINAEYKVPSFIFRIYWHFPSCMKALFSQQFDHLFACEEPLT